MATPTLTHPTPPPPEPQPTAGADTLLGRTGRWCFDHPWRAIGLWLATLVLVVGAASAMGESFSTTSDAGESDSSAGLEVLEQHFPELGAGGGSGTIVFRADQGIDAPEVQAAMEELFATVEAGFPEDGSGGEPRAPGATVLSPYAEGSEAQVARSGLLADELAYAQVNLAADVDDGEAAEIGQQVLERAPQLDGLEVQVGGEGLATIEPPETELIGLAFAVVVLIVAFGSVLAMGLPIAVAVGGVLLGLTGVTVLTNVLTVPEDTMLIGLMIGLGVGIDYALFVVTRYREAVHQGRPARDAVVLAMSTAGRAVVFAGLTVVISMLGLLIVGLGWLTGMGIGISLTVLATMLTSLTLLPALLGLTWERLELTRWRGLLAAGFVAVALLGAGIGSSPLAVAGLGLAVLTLLASVLLPVLRRPVPPRRARPVEQTWSHRWSRTVQRRPVLWLGVGAATLLVLAAPVLAMRLGWSSEAHFPEDTSTRQAYELMAEGFGDGFNGPLLITTEGDPGDAAAVEDLRTALADAPGVDDVSAAIPNDPTAPVAHLITVVPTTGPEDEATIGLVERLRTEVVPGVLGTSEGSGELDVHVTGATATNIDVTDHLSERMPLFFGAVLVVSFLALMVVFRSLLVPLKAVVVNVATIAATYGVVVAVFQWGWGGSVIGIDGGPINPFVPLMLFAVVFGLSMDYEVFMLSRIREEYDRTGDATSSVADGLASTARVITAAAAIMVVVFGSFMFEELREIKLFGFGLALAVLIDATLVRMVVVPSTMALLGHRNWWLPTWLDRILPRVQVDHAGGDVAEPAFDGARAVDREVAEPVGS
jgi:RND superfamily putative drug exporter